MADANINIGVNVLNSQSISQLESQLAALTARVKTVGVGSAEFKKLQAEIQLTQKTLDNANRSLKGFNPEETFGRLAKVASGVGAAFAVANLAFADNEKEAKKLQKTQESLVAILGVAQVAEAALAAFQLLRTNALIDSTDKLVKNSAANNLAAVQAEFAAGAYATEAAAVQALTEALTENAIVEQQAKTSTGEFVDVLIKSKDGAEVATAEFKKVGDSIKIVDEKGQALDTKAIGEKLDAVTNKAQDLGNGLDNAVVKGLKNAANAIKVFITSTTGLITIIAALTAAVFLYFKSVSDAQIATMQYGEELKTLGSTIDGLANEFGPTIKALTIYNSLLQTGSLNAQERKRFENLLRAELKQQGLTQAEINRTINQGTANVNAYIEALIRQARAVALQEELVQVYKDIFKVQADIEKSAPGFFQSLTNFAVSQGNILTFKVKQLQTTAENYSEELEKLNKKAENLGLILQETLKADPAAVQASKKELNKFVKSTEDGLKKTATDIAGFLRQVRDERVKAELEGRAEEIKIAQNSTADQLAELKKQRDEFKKDKTLTKKQKLEVDKAYADGVIAITKNGEEAVREINRDFDQRELERRKANLESRISIEEEALDTEVQLFINANETITRTEVDALKQRETLLLKQIDIDLRRVENLKNNFEEQKKQLEEAKKLAKPEDQGAIQNQIDALISSFEKQLAAITGAVLKSQSEVIQTGEQILLAGVSRETTIRETNALKTIKDARKRNEELRKIAIQDVEARLKIVKKGSDEEIKLLKQLAELQVGSLENRTEKFFTEFRKYYDQVAASLQAVGNILADQAALDDLRLTEELEKVDLIYEQRFKLIDEEEQKLDDLEKAKDTNLTRTERKRIQLAKERAALEAQQEQELAQLEAERANAAADAAIEQANLNFALAIGQIVVSTAEAIAKTIAQLGGVGAITPPGAALIALTGAAGAAQLAAANSAKSAAIAQAEASRPRSVPPQTGRVSRAAGGLIEGPGNGVSDSVPANLSNGEFVVNANSTRQFLPLLNQINQAGLQGGNPVNPGMASDTQMVSLLERIDQKLSQPNRSYVLLNDIENIQNKQNYINRRSNVL